MLLAQGIEQRLGLLQICRVKTLSEPTIDRCQQLARLVRLALPLPQARQAHGHPQLPGFGLLVAGDGLLVYFGYPLAP